MVNDLPNHSTPLHLDRAKGEGYNCMQSLQWKYAEVNVAL